MNFEKFFRKYFRIKNTFYRFLKIKYDKVTRLSPNGEKAYGQLKELVIDLDRLLKEYDLQDYVKQNGLAAVIDRFDNIIDSPRS